MMQIAKDQIVYWFFVVLLALTLALSALTLISTTGSGTTLFEGEPAAVLACQGPGGGSNGSSGYC